MPLVCIRSHRPAIYSLLQSLQKAIEPAAKGKSARVKESRSLRIPFDLAHGRSLRINPGGTGSTGMLSTWRQAVLDLADHTRSCVTPLLIEHANDIIEGDFELLGGYDELEEDTKAKVKQGRRYAFAMDSAEPSSFC